MIQVPPLNSHGKVHTFHRLTVGHKMPATYWIKNKMLLYNGTLRHIIVFFQILYFLEKFVNVECLNKKKGKHTVKKQKKNVFKSHFGITFVT